MKNKKETKPSISQLNKEIDDAMDITNSASTTDCTGLIQNPPVTTDEAENYNDVYNFTPVKSIVPEDDNPE